MRPRVDEVAPAPAWRELLVEGQEALELEAAVHAPQGPAREALAAAERGVGGHEVAEAREVQADLPRPRLPGMGERGSHERLHEAVRRRGGSAHRVEREPAAEGQEAQEAADRALRVEAEDVEVAGVLRRAPQAVHGHRTSRRGAAARPARPRRPRRCRRSARG